MPEHKRLGRGLKALLPETIIPLEQFEKHTGVSVESLHRQILIACGQCPHEILEFWGRNGGVRCVGCGQSWKRERRYIGERPTKSVSLLVKESK